MAIQLPPPNKVDGEQTIRDATQVIDATEWNSLIQAIQELQAFGGFFTPVVDGTGLPDPAQALPSAATQQPGQQYFVTQAGLPSTKYECFPSNSSGVNEWRAIGQSS